ncbi:glycosyltransferase [Acinetobacter sp. YH12129]|uniref:glycosyltransferase family 2 protein n=1 Tax=Acinetobacter sp. YH12129 TaxID=2601114 RepID=UPI0015D1E01A|nr:glycosyltransferase [Acinetobacter sp. YH12129]
MQNQPLVTVYIPTFNRVELLKRAVKSVQDQTYQNLEIIIVDDCSTDGTHEYLKQVSKEDKRVRFFLKETNSGACVSRNIAIENAKGEFITGLDDDDYFDKKRLELFVKNGHKINGDCMGLCTLYSLHYDFGIKKSNKLFKSRKIYQNDLYVSNEIGNQIFTRTEFLQKIEGFNEKLSCLQDLDCWIRLLKKGYILRDFNFTYFVDCSHEGFRITDSKLQKYLESIAIISDENNLEEKHRVYLKNQTINRIFDFDIKMNIATLTNYPSFIYFKFIVVQFFKKTIVSLR